MKTLIKSVLVSVVALLLSVRAWGAVSFNPASVTVYVGWSETVTLSGKSPSGGGSTDTYNITTLPDAYYASASISGKTLTITGNRASGDTTVSCTITHTYSTSKRQTATETGTLNFRVQALPQESRTATMMRGEGLPITADDLDGTITRVKSDNDAVATVTLANGVATITGVRAGTTTVRVRTDSKEYVYTVTVNPLTIRLCVGDVVKLNYDFGGTGNNQGSLLSVTTSGGAVTATCQTQGSSQTSGGTRYYQSGYLQITANAVGTQTVTLNRRIRGQSSTYNEFDTVAVEVLPAREILKGASTDFTCLADVDCAGNANWTALSQSPAGIVSASYGTQTTTSSVVTFTGTKLGTTTVTAKNVKGSNNNLSGAEYQLEVKVTLPKVEGDAITVYEGESVTLADASVDKAWTATSLDTGIATVPASGAAGTGAVITGVKAGTTTVEVEHNDVYYSYEVTVQAKPVVNLTTRFTCVGESVDIPASDFGNLAWKNATSSDTLKGELVATSGTAGTGVTVRGVNPGETLITFETADTIYKAHVQVNSKAQIDLGTVQVRVGQSIVITDTRIAGAWKGASSADAEKVTVFASETGEAGTGPTVTGVDETDEAGVVVTFNDAKRIYTVHVQVFDKLRIDGGVKTVVPPPMNEGDESFEAPGFIPVDPAWGSDYEVSIGNTSFATFEETDEGIIVYGRPAHRARVATSRLGTTSARRTTAR